MNGKRCGPCLIAWTSSIGCRRYTRARIDLTNCLWRSDIQKGAAVSLRSGRSCFSFLPNPILKRRWDRGGAGYQAGAKRHSGLMAGLITDVSSLTEMMLSACTTCVSPHFGHAICIEGGCSDSASARTFMCMPHLHCQLSRPS